MEIQFNPDTKIDSPILRDSKFVVHSNGNGSMAIFTTSGILVKEISNLMQALEFIPFLSTDSVLASQSHFEGSN